MYTLGVMCSCHCHIPGVDLKHIVPCCDFCYEKREGPVDSELEAIHQLPTLRERQIAFMAFLNRVDREAKAVST